MSGPRSPLLLFAPSVHTGGGLVLLQSLLDAWPADSTLSAWLDVRAQPHLRLPDPSNIRWVKPSLGSRLAAEGSLAAAAREGGRILCFHGLPPLLARGAATLVFLQNRNYLGDVLLDEYKLRQRWRLRAEQWISKIWRGRVTSYYVQSPTMARALQQWWGEGRVPVRMLPFVAALQPAQVQGKAWDFIFVSDGEPHKNHRRLVEAWKLLARDGLKPSLALTLTERHASLRDWVQEEARAHGLAISNLPPVPHSEMAVMYGQAAALIFPSLAESFGLPLVEASRLGLPIVASERDFVRDICAPAQTFDPESAIAIARAVRRQLALPEAALQPLSAAEFLVQIDGGAPS